MGLGFRPFDLSEECKVNWREKSLSMGRLLAESREDSWRPEGERKAPYDTRIEAYGTSLCRGQPNSTASLTFSFNWRITALQCCVGFCCTSSWTSCKCTYVPSLLKLPPTPLGRHRAPGWAPCIIQRILISHSKSEQCAHSLTPQSHFSEFTLKNNQWMCANLNL